MKVLVTGASGLLGRAVVQNLKNSGHEVIGTGRSRVGNGLVKLDLLDTVETVRFLEELKPQAVIHCAAERRPDVAEKNREDTVKLNQQIPALLGEVCSKLGAFLIYISTDYVFDGSNPPYDVNDTPNPLQFYGQSKYEGELAIQRTNPHAAILRVPILYGNTEFNGESAVNILLDAVLNTEKKTNMDHFSIRYPTNVEDIARVLKDLCEKRVIQNEPIQGIYHFSATQKLTKYDMCVIMAKALGQSYDHLTPQESAPVAAIADRPVDSHLSNKRLESIGVDTSSVDFAQWWEERLAH
ncbi:NAD(P)-binding protein [Basidiobolus meristosporus CBS 931.73]|uniref:NAD(P)-binding protein n=1 Tax=Basidiobolus meristosporus CBS 931.73 TaxID=1314790 RepID=A0A1Y1Y6G2_9FUNG|nr:NAD(P)-binding protein [Basidiobolus meristosporus CBS 931.73]|eukprot:ORX93607.1 NAD(P)-binding protein [Basidiobolus meristosporus CBS 931.73]